MGNKEEILEILKSKSFTASELSIKMESPVENIKTYLNRLKKEKLIKPVTKKGREILWTVDIGEINGNYKESVELLKFMNTFFKDNLKHLMEKQSIVAFVRKNKDNFKRIEELVKLV